MKKVTKVASLFINEAGPSTTRLIGLLGQRGFDTWRKKFSGYDDKEIEKMAYKIMAKQEEKLALINQLDNEVRDTEQRIRVAQEHVKKNLKGGEEEEAKEEWEEYISMLLVFVDSCKSRLRKLKSSIE